MYVNMADKDQDIAACSSLVVAASLGAAAILNKRKKRTHSAWIAYIRERKSLGAYNALLSELATDEVTRCVQYLRMDISTFEELFLHAEKQITSVCVVS